MRGVIKYGGFERILTLPFRKGRVKIPGRLAKIFIAFTLSQPYK